MRWLLFLATLAEATPCPRHMRTSDVVADGADCDPTEIDPSDGISALLEEAPTYTPKPTPAITWDTIPKVLAQVSQMRTDMNTVMSILNASRKVLQDSVRNERDISEQVAFMRSAVNFEIPSTYNLAAAKYNSLAVATNSNYGTLRRLAVQINGLRNETDRLHLASSNITGFMQQQESDMHSKEQKTQADVDKLTTMLRQLNSFHVAGHNVIERQRTAMNYVGGVQNELESQIIGIQDLLRGLVSVVFEEDDAAKWNDKIEGITANETNNEINNRGATEVPADSTARGRV